MTCTREYKKQKAEKDAKVPTSTCEEPSEVAEPQAQELVEPSREGAVWEITDSEDDLRYPVCDAGQFLQSI